MRGPGRRAVGGLLVLAAVGIAPPVAAGAILERVLSAIARAEMGGLGSALANVAENASRMTDQPRALQRGDEVIIGYDALGSAVTARADLEGLRLSPATAATLTRGLAGGIYPVGTALYRLPPAGQLSLFQEGQDGQRLALAREFLISRIDGSIDVAAFALVSEDPEVVAAADLSVTLADPLIRATSDQVATTVLGAVNSGQVLKGWALAGETPAQVSSVLTGTNCELERAMTSASQAMTLQTSPLGDLGSGTALALNAAGNAAEVTGALRIHIAGVSARIGVMASTVIGAVNTGVVRTPAP